MTRKQYNLLQYKKVARIPSPLDHTIHAFDYFSTKTLELKCHYLYYPPYYFQLSSMAIRNERGWLFFLIFLLSNLTVTSIEFPHFPGALTQYQSGFIGVGGWEDGGCENYLYQ